MNGTVYISYARNDGGDTDEWVKNLAIRLSDLGVSVVFDDLSFGATLDINTAALQAAMQASVVLIVCTPLYRQKALNHVGGVGREYPILKYRFNPYSNDGKVLFLLKSGTAEESLPEERVPIYFDFTEPAWESVELAKLLDLLPRTPLSTRDVVPDWIDAGRVDDALALLSSEMPEALLLQSQYCNGKKQLSLGLTESGEFGQLKNRVGAILRDFAVRGNSKTILSDDMRVYIVSHPSDGLKVRPIRDYLKNNGLAVFLNEDAPAGIDLGLFADDNLSKSNFLLPIISERSLLSAWENKSMSASLLVQRIKNTRVIPIRLDDAVNDNQFIIRAMGEIRSRISKVQEVILRSNDSNVDIRFIQDELSRELDLQNNLSPLIGSLRERKIVNLADADRFEFEMEQLLRQIKGR